MSEFYWGVTETSGVRWLLRCTSGFEPTPETKFVPSTADTTLVTADSTFVTMDRA